MELREAKTSDYESIVKLIPTPEELFLVYPKGVYPFTVEQVRSLADTRKELTVADQGNEIIGFANLYDIEPQKCAFVGNVVVSGAYRSKGIGRKLLTHMIQLVFDKYQIPEARISVFNDNTPALLLYASLNFKPYAIEERKNPSGKRVALVHMCLERKNYQA